MFDRVRRHGIKRDGSGWETDTADLVLRGMVDCEVFSIDNVGTYWANAAGGQVVRANDLPTLAPPFRRLWLEYGWPYVDVGSNPVAGHVFSPDRFTAETDADELQRAARGIIRSVGVFIAATDAYSDPAYVDTLCQEMPAGDRERVRWLLHVAPLVEATKGRPASRPSAMLTFPLDSDGAALGVDGGVLKAITATDHVNAADHQALCALAGMFVSPALMAISFMHCKNVRVVDQTPPAKASKIHQRKHGHGLTKYKTLEIDPMRETLRGKGRIGEVGLKQALHICRGHFKTYTEDRPLFGKKTGTYWWPQHVRGEEKSGRIVKDYSVRPPG